MLTGDMQRQQLEEAQRAILQAKCKGYFFVVLGIGRKVNIKEVYSFASEPNDVFFKFVDKSTELNEEPLMRFGRLLPSFVSSENAFYLPPDLRKQCDWFQGDQPVKNGVKFGHKQINPPHTANSSLTSKVVTTMKPVTTTKPTAIVNLPPAKPAPARPAPAQPVLAKPDPAKPAQARPAPAKPASAKLVPPQPVHVQPAPAQTASVRPAPAKPAPPQPAAAKPVPAKPAVPAQPAPPQPAAAKEGLA